MICCSASDGETTDDIVFETTLPLNQILSNALTDTDASVTVSRDQRGPWVFDILLFSKSYFESRKSVFFFVSSHPFSFYLGRYQPGITLEDPDSNMICVFTKEV